MIQLERDVAEQDIIVEVPSDAAQVEEPTLFSTQDLSIVLIKGSIDIPKFIVTKE